MTPDGTQTSMTKTRHTCKCRAAAGEVDIPAHHRTRPDDTCPFCAEKHIAAAYSLHNEGGYTAMNRYDLMGNLTLAQWHLWQVESFIARKIRGLRHLIQNRREKESGPQWRELIDLMDRRITEILNNDENGFSADDRAAMMSNHLLELLPRNLAEKPKLSPPDIYIFSNVSYSIENKINPSPDDLLVFLNHGRSLPYYSDHPNRIVIHRSIARDYGDPIQGVRNLYIFRAAISTPADVISYDLIRPITSAYNMDYTAPAGVTKCPTTGFYAVGIMESIFPDSIIHLVNFGENVKNSTFRYPAHNWIWEDEQFSRFHHIYTEESR